MIEYDDVYNLAIQYPKSYMMVILRDMTIANKISTDAQRYIFEYINSLDGSFINKYIEYVCGIYFNLNTPLPIRLQHIAVMSFECGDIGISVFKNFYKSILSIS